MPYLVLAADHKKTGWDSSGVEHLFEAQGVVGSIPSPSTNERSEYVLGEQANFFACVGNRSSELYLSLPA